MKTNSYSMSTTLRLAFTTLVLASLACSFQAGPGTVEPEAPEATPTSPEGPSPQAEPTATESEQTPVETDASVPTTAPTTGPRCTVLQDLNFRSGPGTAYNPPIRALPANTELIPLGYNPVGVPGGSWVQVRNPANQEVGWVSAGAAFVSCNIDLTTLAPVAVDPPQPRQPRAETSVPDGSCGEGGVPDEQHLHLYDCDVRFVDDVPVQFLVFKDGQEIGQNDGVLNVVFRVEQNGDTIYTRTESMAAYCLFGGDDPCNLWVLEDFVYKWESGGAPVQPGEYLVNMDANLDDPFVVLHWDAIVEITLE